MDADHEDAGSKPDEPLQDGSLEDLPASMPDPAVEPIRLRAQLEFTGTGAEYFRIWIVHTLLTILSLGIYSAWAKVRKARWFAQHTRLLGDSFDFHGRPFRILLGRCVALVLFIAYSHSFDWSPTAGIVVILLLLALGPLLFGSAQRFRLVNTSWRGLRFGFDAPRTRVYAVCVPLVLVWTGSTVWTAMQGSLRGALIVGAVSTLLWPAMHAALKTLQHRHARLGALHFDFRRSIGAFYGLYARMFGFSLLIFLLLVLVSSAVFALLAAADITPPRRASQWRVLGVFITGLLIYIMCWPYFAARMQQLVWARTTAGGLRFSSSIRAIRLWKLVLGRMLLVIITLGFYWPFAAVAIAKYRVESLSVEVEGQWPLIEAPSSADANAVGDATLDFFDLDLGW
jgi:uncharacterized membrane protein YjgN (DUF898 family)